MNQSVIALKRWNYVDAGGAEMVRGVAMTAKPRANGVDARSKEAHPCPTKGDLREGSLRGKEEFS